MSRAHGERKIEMIALTLNPIDIKAVLDYVTTEESGGIDIFIGTSRNHSNGKPVSLLEYEAYEPMALNMMEHLVVDAERRWALNRVALVHRLGSVPVAEASVVVAVSAAHRNEAFEACRFLIDALKKEVPIWKREYFSDGSVEWSGATERKEHAKANHGT
jgi:molybdopterin synthase catalytic subunit